MEASKPSTYNKAPNNNQHAQLRVLLVEDSYADAEILSSVIRNLSCHVEHVEDGMQAIETFFSEKFDLVIIDVNLPSVSGLTVAQTILADGRATPVIFTSASVDNELLKECYEIGAHDFLFKPYNAELLKTKLRGYKNSARMLGILETQRDLIARNNRQLVSEKKSARKIFQKIIDKQGQEHPNIRYSLNALSVFNGDVFLFAESPSGELFVLLGDFTGHGLTASLSSMPLIHAFHAMVGKGFGLSAILEEINQRLFQELPREIFCCAIAATLNPLTNELHIWNGGMPVCYVCHEKDRSISEFGSAHLPLGVLSSDDFRCKIKIHKMDAGDTLLMFSDGVTEAQDKNDKNFGQERVRQLLPDCSDNNDCFFSIQDAVIDFTQGGLRRDDVSLVEVSMPEPTLLEPIKIKADDQYNSEEVSLSGCLTYLIDAQMMKGSNNPVTQMMQILLEVPSMQRIKAQLFTVTTELYANALDHGLLELSSDIKATPEGFGEFYRLRKNRLEELSGEENIEFKFDYEVNTKGGKIRIRTKDSGQGFDVKGWQEKVDKKALYSGRGLELMKNISSEMTISEKGNAFDLTLLW